MTSVLVFDIETVPDADGLRKLYKLNSDLTPTDIVEMAFQSRRQTVGNDLV